MESRDFGVAPAHLRVLAAPLLRPEEQIFKAMMDGWQTQQLSRNLSSGTIEGRNAILRRFQGFTSEYPWQWKAADFEDWLSELRADDNGIAPSTMRSYTNAISMFCGYLTDMKYSWVDICDEQFGATPSQIVFEWNSVAHVNDYEGNPAKRALTRVELQTFFDVIDDEVERLQSSGSKGWVAALRDSAAFKTKYAFGLRRTEVTMLTLEDLGRNPHAAEFGDFGVIYVRYGKASHGGAPKRRSVLTVMPWSVEILRDWVGTQRSQMPTSARDSALWPSERAGRISPKALGERFSRYKEQAGLPGELTPHCLRHSYVTHLIEDGFDPLFVQEQVGHAHASTTSIYTSVSSDFRAKTLRNALDQAVNNATKQE